MVLGYGSPEYFGLGLSVILMLVLINIVGSPFMKNSAVILALFGVRRNLQKTNTHHPPSHISLSPALR